jgi:DNA replication and repair protein RecF
MRVVWLSLTNFRSYPSLEWEPDAGVNLLVGGNGAGKTNILESINYLATLRSFRSVTDRDLVTDRADSSIIRAGAINEGRDRLVEIEIRRAGPRQTQVDKNRLRRTADLLGVVRVISFLPEDLDLVKRGPAHRRDLLDSVSVQLWPAAHLEQGEFDRSLRQRNAFLREGGRDESTLSVWDSRLAQSGGRILGRRAGVIELINPLLQTTYRDVSRGGEEASLGYSPSWSDGPLGARAAADYSAELVTALQSARQDDYQRRLTTVGPHRDEPSFLLDGADNRTHGSQGEQRTMALAVKLSAHRAVADLIGESPILLLDDVFSELDAQRSDALARCLPADTQTIITSARPEDLPVDGARWTVDGGLKR